MVTTKKTANAPKRATPRQPLTLRTRPFTAPECMAAFALAARIGEGARTPELEEATGEYGQRTPMAAPTAFLLANTYAVSYRDRKGEPVPGRLEITQAGIDAAEFSLSGALAQLDESIRECPQSHTGKRVHLAAQRAALVRLAKEWEDVKAGGDSDEPAQAVAVAGTPASVDRPADAPAPQPVEGRPASRSRAPRKLR